MHTWQEVLKIALLGTDRYGERPRAASPGLDALIAAVYERGGEREQAFLDALAAAALYRRCGVQPTRAPQPAAEPAAPDARPAVGATAARHLALILAEERFTPLLAAWLEAVAAAGKRVPEAQLPALLDRGTGRRDLRERIAAVVGERGAWLAGFRPEWGYARGATEEAPPPSQWEEGSLEMRLAFLRRLRARDPGEARARLEAVWKAEPARSRAQLLAALAVGLRAEDEPFLEATLDDKSKEVRQQAATLLAALPDSGFLRRWRERARGVVAVKAKSGVLAMLGSGIGDIELALPEELPADWARDGILDTPPGGKGRKAWWLEQLLGLVPPGDFTGDGRHAPAALLGKAAGHEWREALLAGWAEGARRHGDAAWAEAFLELDPLANAPLWAVLPQPRRETLFAGLLERTPPEALSRALRQLEGFDHAWSPAFSLEVVKACQRMASRPPGGADYPIYGVLRAAAAAHISPDITDQAGALLRPHLEGETPWTRILSEVIELVRLRRDMLEAIADQE